MKQLYTAAIKDNKPIDSQKLLGSVADLFQSRNTIVEMFDMLYNMRTWPIRFMRTVSTLHSFHE